MTFNRKRRTMMTAVSEKGAVRANHQHVYTRPVRVECLAPAGGRIVEWESLSSSRPCPTPADRSHDCHRALPPIGVALLGTATVGIRGYGRCRIGPLSTPSCNAALLPDAPHVAAGKVCHDRQTGPFHGHARGRRKPRPLPTPIVSAGMATDSLEGIASATAGGWSADRLGQHERQQPTAPIAAAG